MASSLFDMDSCDAVGEQVIMNLHIALRRAYVDPVSTWWNVCVERFLAFEKIRKQSIFERVVFTSRQEIKNLRFKDVRTRVDRLAGNLIRLRFLEKPSNATITLNFNQAVILRILYRSEDDSRYRFSFGVLSDNG